MSPSGCNGNQNNFANKEECEAKCRLHLKPETRTSSNLQIDEVHDPICALPSETGPCRAMKPRYYYNSQKQKCERYENVAFFWLKNQNVGKRWKIMALYRYEIGTHLHFPYLRKMQYHFSPLEILTFLLSSK